MKHKQLSPLPIGFLCRLLMIGGILLSVRFGQAQEGNTPEFEQRKGLLELYMKAKDAIEAEDKAAFEAQATLFHTELKKMRLKGIPGQHLGRMMSLRDSLRSNSLALSKLKDLEKIKTSFSAISTQLWSVMDVMKFSDAPVYLQYCPMEKAYWVHTNKAIRNPYNPIEMPDCGKVVGNVTEENYKVADCCHI
ncbi:Protein of unknown function [Sphingobacterium nematocida]|uniref:DUF3347 domain-containing protein n=1 Tax=Sphingobacterium nematocida TaxID=1513896 RepID=A0A1T5BP68_9SPHI|nr:DUF3347 domain-containing protein [Sphingobacterium nematocida]SKB49074.1 Protein of unknown function [Sphingobacterium nematocida]